LGEFVILGIETTLPLFQQLLEDPDFLASNFDVKWLEGFVAELQEKKAA
jgi:acetyl-CoA carboxylase biotin carboxylase subunit